MHNNRFEILEGLPVYGPMYIPVSPDEIPFYFEGFVVRFFKRDGTSWVANFQSGRSGFSEVYDFPELKRTVVIANGQCFIMADDEQKPLKVFGSVIIQIFQAVDNVLIAVHQTDIIVIDMTKDLVSHSERITWDGFRDINFSGDSITGLAYDPGGDYGYWIPFSFNYKTMELSGGAFSSLRLKRPWWRIW